MTWSFVYVLPNLSLDVGPKEHFHGKSTHAMDLGTDHMLVTGSKDARASAAIAKSPAATQIVTSFKDLYGKSYDPAVLLIRDSAPDWLKRDLEATVSFRNALAMSVVLYGRAAMLKGSHGQSPTWSDTFDFHPAQIGGTGRMVIQSPALLSVVATKKEFFLTNAPGIPIEGKQMWTDAYVYKSLGSAWRSSYSRKRRSDQFGKSLFRSLEVAYTAAGVGAKNQGSLHDYGLQVALWVSAIEILAWPTAQYANFKHVIDLLEKAPMPKRLSARRYQLPGQKKVPRVKAIVKAYSYLYTARNDFLHGNPVAGNTLFTKAKGDRTALPALAATVYRAALVAYLDQRYPAQILTLEEFASRADEWSGEMAFNDALCAAFEIERD